MSYPDEAIALNPANGVEDDQEILHGEMRAQALSALTQQVPTRTGITQRNEYYPGILKCIRQYILFSLVIVIVFTLHFMFNILWYGVVESHGTTIYKPEVCNTSTCQLASQRISSFLNRKINPCEDFYAFACGRTTVENIGLPGFMHQSQWNVHKKIAELIREPERTTESMSVNIARQMYYTCVSNDFRSSNDEDMKALIEVMPSLFDRRAEIERTFAESIAYNVQAIFQIRIAQDDVSRKIVLEFSKPEIQNFYVYETEEEKLSRKTYYKEELRRLLPWLTKQQADDLMYFESQLRNFSLKSSKKQIRQFDIWGRLPRELITLDQLSQRIPQVNWFHLLDHLSEILGHELKISSDIKIVLIHPTYFKDTATLIHKSKTRTVKNYIAWNFIQSFLPFLGSYLETSISSDQLPNPVGEDTKALNRRHSCMSIVRNDFQNALTYLYVKRTSMENATNIVDMMFNYIKEEFLQTLGKEKWIPEGIEYFKENLRNKVRNMKIQIGYQDYFKNVTAVDEQYTGLQLNSSSFIVNLLSLRKFQVLQTLSHIPVVQKEQRNSSTLDVNAYYILSRNEIEIPIVTLSSPMFDENYPMYWNFASLGTIIAHELLHGFDSLGRHYDHSGNLSYWWPDEVEMPFRSHASCFLRMFDKFQLPGNRSLNGNITLAENIADSAMLKLAFKGYQAWAKESQIKEPLLPGFEFTIQQIFHVIYAQTFCEDLANNVYIDDYLDVHSPEEFRVTATIQNDDSFGEVFQCPVGSPMNPPEKCTVWS